MTLATEIQALRDNPCRLAPCTKILDREGNLTPFHPTPAQQRLSLTVLQDRWVIILKARQLGSTTIILWTLLVQALYRPGYRVLVVAQTWRTALKFAEILHRFVDHLPPPLLPPAKKSQLGVAFPATGSLIEVQTASSASTRGTTYNAILASEVAFWAAPETAARALFQALSGRDTLMVLESTPSGMNGFHSLWTSSDHGLRKIFLSWLEEPTYRRDTPTPIPPELQEYIEAHDLPPDRARWAAHRLATQCLGSMATFLQEFAIDPTSCFLRSGDAFFTLRPGWEHAGFYAGLKTHARPTPKRIYAVGVDSASGSSHPDADYSAAVVLDVTTPARPTIAAVLVSKEIPSVWAASVVALARRYGRPKTTVILNIERTGGWGLPVIEACRKAKLKVFQQRRPSPKSHTTFSDKFGWDTTRETRAEMLAHLQAVVNSETLDLIDERLQYQAARFAYIDGRPDHPPGEHDDCLIALALALQVSIPARRTDARRPLPYPQSHQEILRLEHKYGRPFRELRAEGKFDRLDTTPQYVGWDASEPGW